MIKKNITDGNNNDIEIDSLLQIINNTIKINNSVPINNYDKKNSLCETDNINCDLPDILIDSNTENCSSNVNQSIELDNTNNEGFKELISPDKDCNKPNDLIYSDSVKYDKLDYLIESNITQPDNSILPKTINSSNVNDSPPLIKNHDQIDNPEAKFVRKSIIIDKKKLNANSREKKQKKNVSFSPYEFIDLEENNLELYNSNLVLFDFKISQKYSFGSDLIMFNYGRDYFAFFRRLGHINYFIIKHNERKIIIGTLCMILRKFTLPKRGKNNMLFWYICDLKIDTEYRGQKLTSKLFEHIFYRMSLITRRGYLITMNPTSQHIIHIINELQSTICTNYTSNKLLIYMVPFSIMKIIERFFICAFGKITYITLSGIKDIIFHNKKNVKIYHLHHETNSALTNKLTSGIKLSEIQSDSMIMFCFPKASPLENIMNDFNIQTDISATIISWSMDFFDWHDILTSDI